jgi:hypothetical protein
MLAKRMFGTLIPAMKNPQLLDSLLWNLHFIGSYGKDNSKFWRSYAKENAFIKFLPPHPFLENLPFVKPGILIIIQDFLICIPPRP